MNFLQFESKAVSLNSILSEKKLLKISQIINVSSFLPIVLFWPQRAIFSHVIPYIFKVDLNFLHFEINKIYRDHSFYKLNQYVIAFAEKLVLRGQNSRKLKKVENFAVFDKVRRSDENDKFNLYYIFTTFQKIIITQFDV